MNPVLMEFHARLLRRPDWSPSRYRGTCVSCGRQVQRGDPVILLQTARGPCWTCSCVFMPELSAAQKLQALREADEMIA